MDTRVRDLLAGRQRRTTGRRVGSAAVSMLLHAGITGVFLFAPALAARDEEPMPYTKVQIVPLRALGVPDPEPVRPAPPKPAPQPEPESEKPAPQPEPEAEKKRLPSPDATQRPTTRTPPAPTSPSAASDRGAGSERPAQRAGTPDGNPLGLAPFGSNATGFDDPDFQYSYYRDMLLAIIGSNWRRPSIGTEVELIVHFRIARDGTIFDAEITQPSGYASFDQAGLSAVRSSTLPKLPVSYPNDSLGVSLIIR